MVLRALTYCQECHEMRVAMNKWLRQGILVKYEFQLV